MQDYSTLVDYSAANLMTFVMVNFAVGSGLQRLGYLTFIDSIFVLAFVAAAVTVIANVIILLLDVTGRENAAKKMGRNNSLGLSSSLHKRYRVYLLHLFRLGLTRPLSILFHHAP